MRQRLHFFIAAASLAIILVAVLVWGHRLRSDFLPLDRSPVGPNVLAEVAQLLFLAVVTAFVVEPVRRAVNRRLGPMEQNLKEAREHREWEAKRVAEIFERQMGHKPPRHPHFDVGQDGVVREDRRGL